MEEHPRRFHWGSTKGYRQVLPVGIAVIGLILGMTACGGGAPSAAVAHGGTTTTEVPAAGGGARSSGGALVEYARCMRSHGVASFPDSASFGSSAGIRAAKGQIAQVSASEASSPTFQAAQRACSQYAPTQRPAPHVSAQELQKLLAVSRCMRAHGVPNFPDPNPNTGDFAVPAGLSKTSPIVLAAVRACSSLGEAAGLRFPNTGQ
jgi:hypothetical protein